MKNRAGPTLAVVLSKLKPEHAARVLAILPEDLALDVVGRMLKMEAVQKEVIERVEQTLRLEFMSNLSQTRRRDALVAGGAADKAPGISCKRRDILKLEVADWRDWADRVEAGFVRAARFLYGQKIFKARDLPYRTQLVPLAAMFVDRASLETFPVNELVSMTVRN